jgi:hypothetical protein
LGFGELWVASSTSEPGAARGASLEFVFQFPLASNNCYPAQTGNEGHKLLAAPPKSIRFMRRNPATFLLVQVGEEHIQLMM